MWNAPARKITDREIREMFREETRGRSKRGICPDGYYSDTRVDGEVRRRNG